MNDSRYIGPGPDITQPPYEAGAQPMTGHPSLEARVRTQIAAMNAPQHAAASQAQDQVAAILHGLALKSPDPAARLSMARHIAGLHPELGIAPQAISLADVTDQGLAEHLAAVMALKDHLGRGAAGQTNPSTIGATPMSNPSAQSGAQSGAQPGVRYLGVAR